MYLHEARHFYPVGSRFGQYNWSFHWCSTRLDSWNSTFPFTLEQQQHQQDFKHRHRESMNYNGNNHWKHFEGKPQSKELCPLLFRWNVNQSLIGNDFLLYWLTQQKDLFCWSASCTPRKQKPTLLRLNVKSKFKNTHWDKSSYPGHSCPVNSSTPSSVTSATLKSSISILILHFEFLGYVM